jgi:hypothetical protein
MTSFEPPSGRAPGGPEPVFPPPPPPSAPGAPGLPPPPPVMHMVPVQGVARPIGGIATAASVLLGIASLVSVGVAIALLNRAGLIDRLDLTSRPTSSELDEIESADRFVAGMNVVLILALLSTGIVFIIWQYQYAKNAEVLNHGPLGLGPGWAIGGWFIPFANLVLPFLQLRRSAGPSDPERGRVPGILTAWTIVYIGASVIVLGGVGTRPKDDEAVFNVADTVDKFQRADTIMGVGLLIYAVAGVLAIIMVRTLTLRQQTTITALANRQYH